MIYGKFPPLDLEKVMHREERENEEDEEYDDEEDDDDEEPQFALHLLPSCRIKMRIRFDFGLAPSARVARGRTTRTANPDEKIACHLFRADVEDYEAIDDPRCFW